MHKDKFHKVKQVLFSCAKICFCNFLKFYVWYLGITISTSTPAGIKKYLSKVQVLSNVYLKVLKYKYPCTWPHA